jgi:hypothetical protein
MTKGYRIVLIVLALLTLVSLALNGATILWSLYTRQITLTVLSGARATVADVGDETFSYTFEVNREIPIAASVPISKSVVVPIRATIPVSTVVIIPVNAGILGTFDVDVPIRTMIPVSLDVTVPISETVNIATVVQLDLEVPIEIPIAETPLAGYLESLDAALRQIEVRLEDPLGSVRE